MMHCSLLRGFDVMREVQESGSERRYPMFALIRSERLYIQALYTRKEKNSEPSIMLKLNKANESNK